MPTEQEEKNFSVTKETRKFFVRGKEEFVGALRYKLFGEGITHTFSRKGDVTTINLLVPLTDIQVAHLMQYLSRAKNELEASSTDFI